MTIATPVTTVKICVWRTLTSRISIASRPTMIDGTIGVRDFSETFAM